MAVEILRSACPLDCPDSCSLEVRVEDGRVIKLDADGRNPYAQGTICGKVRGFPERLYAPERIAHPMRRVGAKGSGDFERISWEDALGTIAERLATARARTGGSSILPYSYGGSNGVLSQNSTDALLFERLGAIDLDHTVCAAATGRAATGLYGKMTGVALDDYVHAQLIVVWGANPAASGIHLIPVLQEAQRRGAKLVVVDPLRSGTAKRADLHLQPHPGTDVAVALALHRHLFEEGHADQAFLREHTSGAEELRRRAAPWTFERAAEVSGVPAAALRSLAELYVASNPAVVRCGWGLERNRNGGSAVASVIALPAVAGKFGVVGGGYTMSNSGQWKFGEVNRTNSSADEFSSRTNSSADEFSGPRGRGMPRRKLNMNLLGEALAERASDGTPSIDVLFVYNSNALATTPRQNAVRDGLEREDLFTVVFEQVLTDTARYADIVLPATTFLEHDEISRGYGALVLHRARPAIAPVGEARPNLAVFADLLQRLALDRPGDALDPATLYERLVPDASTRQALDERGTVRATFDGAERPIQFVNVFPKTADRKVHLVPEALDHEAPLGLYGFQENPWQADGSLTLLSPSTNKRTSSTFGERVKEKATVDLSPGEAGRRGLKSGDWVEVSNRFGRVELQARVTDDVPDGIAVMVKGLWDKDTRRGGTANALAPDSLTDLGGGACFNDARVEIRRLEH
jgi:anaerobic selenocysteine-containing dehydrogenase